MLFALMHPYESSKYNTTRRNKINSTTTQYLCQVLIFGIDLFQFLMSDRLHEKCLINQCTHNKINIKQMTNTDKT